MTDHDTINKPIFTTRTISRSASESNNVVVAAQANASVISELNELKHWRYNRIIHGLYLEKPFTPSTQSTGAVPPTVRVNRRLGQAIVEGLIFTGFFTARLGFPGNGTIFDRVDEEISSSPILTVGQSVICVNVLAARPSIGFAVSHFVWGLPATAGSEQPPSDAIIRASLVAWIPDLSTNYIRVGYTTIHRAGDTMLEQWCNDVTYRDI